MGVSPMLAVSGRRCLGSTRFASGFGPDRPSQKKIASICKTPMPPGKLAKIVAVVRSQLSIFAGHEGRSVGDGFADRPWRGVGRDKRQSMAILSARPKFARQCRRL